MTPKILQFIHFFRYLFNLVLQIRQRSCKPWFTSVYTPHRIMNFTKLMKPLIAFCLADRLCKLTCFGSRYLSDSQRIWQISPPCFHASVVRHSNNSKWRSYPATSDYSNTLLSSQRMGWAFQTDSLHMSSMVQEESSRQQTLACDDRAEAKSRFWSTALTQTQNHNVIMIITGQRCSTCCFFHVFCARCWTLEKQFSSALWRCVCP